MWTSGEERNGPGDEQFPPPDFSPANPQYGKEQSSHVRVLLFPQVPQNPATNATTQLTVQTQMRVRPTGKCGNR